MRPRQITDAQQAGRLSAAGVRPLSLWISLLPYGPVRSVGPHGVGVEPPSLARCFGCRTRSVGADSALDIKSVGAPLAGCQSPVEAFAWFFLPSFTAWAPSPWYALGPRRAVLLFRLDLICRYRASAVPRCAARSASVGRLRSRAPDRLPCWHNPDQRPDPPGRRRCCPRRGALMPLSDTRAIFAPCWKSPLRR